MPQDKQYDPNAGDHVIVNGNPVLTRDSSAMAGRCLAVEFGEWLAADTPEELFGNRRWAKRRTLSDTAGDRELGKRFDEQSLGPLVGLGRLRDVEGQVRDVRAGTHSVRITAFDTARGDQLVVNVLPAYLRDAELLP